MAKMTAKQKCWKAFAEFIRLRDSENGYANCISCNKMVAYPNGTGALHAGHFYPRSTTYAALYFHERNVNGQCSHCNYFLEGNTEAYRKGLIRKYGDEIIDELDIIKLVGARKMHSFEYEAMAKHYRQLVRDMKKVRGI